MDLLKDLNLQQQQAVLQTEGPAMVLAGAGTGKTRVITYRVACLIERGVPAHAILAVTFTNKAAQQMRERVANLLRAGGRDASDIWISTFHSLCSRLLRREAASAALPPDFTIYDDDAQTDAIKLAIQKLELKEIQRTPRNLRERISYAKNCGVSPSEMARAAEDDDQQQAAQIYAAYEAILRLSGALDFDDLLIRAVELLRTGAAVRERWSRRFRYILVDEFQDTNRWQEELVRLLAGAEKNVCVVGDEDQSIYSWRGAKAGGFQRFLDDFPGTKIFRIEENYRSTQTILDASGAVVANNQGRLGKKLLATIGPGIPVRYFEAMDSSGEAEYITGEIASLLRTEPDRRIAVLYRTTAQSRPFEELLRSLRIRYRVVGGASFYLRAEVRDALAYLRLVYHPQDDVALLRVLNTPPRGIGDKTKSALIAEASSKNAPIWQILRDRAKTHTALENFRRLIDGFRGVSHGEDESATGGRATESALRDVRALPPGEMLREILNRSGYLGWVEQQDNLGRTTRAENLSELANSLAEAAERGQALEDFLDQVALTSQADEYDDEAQVSLMTLHSAKGLEFDAVFLAGLEEGALPHIRSLAREEDMEEERRLCYVGMTRAKNLLTLTRAIYRRTYGEERLRASQPSRFLSEIPGHLLETVAGSLAEAGATRRYEPDPEYSDSYALSRARRAPRASPSRPGATDNLLGMRVRHPTYGVGTIIRVEGEDDDRRFTVSFVDYGTKKLLERFANLQPA